MFFFFVGGVEQQAGRVLKEAAGRCFRCGGTADSVEYDKVLKIFFIPLWRWPGKPPAFHCRDCNGDSSGSNEISAGSRPSFPLQDLRCQSCACPVNPQFRFCPHCGSAL
ncbi:hypothetical protein KSP39_PZI019906 [Platanthera zijinensis]|uniref:Zinc-ribbon 15 domain-containing protein n=1 Tax=Platanthera zijinensis TaxID=2320716 RepID=A0AAP0FWR4_9ASPA